MVDLFCAQLLKTLKRLGELPITVDILVVRSSSLLCFLGSTSLACLPKETLSYFVNIINFTCANSCVCLH